MKTCVATMRFADANYEFEKDSLKERGRKIDGLFAHYCNDWDGMTVDETCAEISSCNCTFCAAPCYDNADSCYPCANVPEEVKQNARDYYDALDPFSGMSGADRCRILHGSDCIVEGFAID